MFQLDQSIRKAELVALQLRMEEKFNENIRVLKKRLPSLYKVFSNYKAKNKTVSLDAGGYPNIFDENKSQIYPDNPEEYTRKQVQYYFERSVPSVIRFRKKETVDTGYIHQKFMGELTRVEYSFGSKTKDRRFCPTLFIFGVGFGYHIPSLINDMDVRNLCIYEPDFDCFYWSLFTIDWGEVVDYFSATGRNVEFVLGDKVESVMSQISLFFDRIGIYNLVHISTFKHLSSNKINEVSSFISKDAAKLASAIGFYDDEKVGFAHTYENVRKGFPIASKSLGQRGDLATDTLVLVGNGPSLDRAKEFLESVKGKLPILSCGTTLGSLQRMGIKPDLHVEQERALSTFHWV
ncbi:MAG: motility associated factor glycosyltransferase family protein, partial [Oceanospirillaceae bacterium]|nr:motility associated factor glycosyltransferase family protein [Oceanospirillaceae bacterium]